MGKLKFSENLFLGKAELERLKQFLDDDGFRKYILDNSSVEFGLIDNYRRDSNQSEFPNARVELGTNTGTIKHKQAAGIDKDGLFVFKEAQDNISVPNDNNWYWIRLQHSYSDKEDGVVEVDSNGNLTGSDTEFTKILRGQPNFPSKIKFLNSQNNNDLEYEVLEVIDDENAILQGVFNSESDLEFAVVGTFTPDSNPPSTDKDIFQYDSANLEKALEQTNNAEPNPNKGKKIPLARVKNDGGDITIQDKRRDIYKTTASYFAQNIDKNTNPLIGIEAIKYETNPSPKNKNIVEIAWGFRSSNYTINASLNKITISGGQGGVFKDTSSFSASDFNGWRVYTSNGNYRYVKSSNLDASQINLFLDKLDIDDFSNDGGQSFTGDQIVVVPDADEIYLEFVPEDGYEQKYTQSFYYPINEGLARIPIYHYNTNGSQYKVYYTNKKNGEYSAKLLINEDPTGYYDEDSFDEQGALLPDSIDRTRVQVGSDGIITMQLSATNFNDRLNSVSTGDLLSINQKELNNGDPTLNLKVGQNSRYQIIDGNNLTLNTNHYINLVSQGANEANSFILDFRNGWSLNGNVIQIVQDYSGQGNAVRAKAVYQVNAVSGGKVFTVEVDKQDGNGYVEIATYTASGGDDASTVVQQLATLIDNNRDDFDGIASGNTLEVDAVPTSNVQDTENNWLIRQAPSADGDVSTTDFSGSNIIISFGQKQLDASERHSLLYYCRFTNDNWFVKEIISNKSEFDTLQVNNSINLDSDWKIYKLNNGNFAIENINTGERTEFFPDGSIDTNGDLDVLGDISSGGSITDSGGNVLSDKIDKSNSKRFIDVNSLTKETIGGYDFVTLTLNSDSDRSIQYYNGNSNSSSEVYIARIDSSGFTLYDGFKLILFTNQKDSSGNDFFSKLGIVVGNGTTTNLGYSDGDNIERVDRDFYSNVYELDDNGTIVAETLRFNGNAVTAVNLFVELTYFQGTWFVTAANLYGVG